MPIRYEIQPDLVLVEITGVLRAEEIFGFYQDAAKDPAFRPGMPFLVDARRVTDAAPFQELHATAREARVAPVFARPTRSAALVSSQWMYGIVRQWAAISGDTLLVTQPFFDEDEARQWLREPFER